MNLIPTHASALKILVLGAAGKTGSAVVVQLLSIDDPHWRQEHAMGPQDLADEELHSHRAPFDLSPTISEGDL